MERSHVKTARLAGAAESGYTLPEVNRREWARRAAEADIPPLRGDARRHAKSIADELGGAAFDDDPYTVALATGEALARRYLTDEIIEGLDRLRRPGGTPYVVIRNVPIGQLPWDRAPIPTDGRRPPWKCDWTSEMTVLGTVQAAGLESLGYFEEAGGALVQEVAPVNGREATNSGTGRKTFGFHTDNAIHPRPYRAEGIALLGLVNDGAVQTLLAPVEAVLERLTPGQIEALSQELYMFPSPESFDYGRRLISSSPRAVLSRGPRGEVEVSAALYSVMVCGRRAEARMAIDALDALEATLVPPVVRPIVIGPGDLLLMSNVRCMHGRDSIPGLRWLQRVYYRESLDDLRANSMTADTRLNRRFHTRPILAPGT